MDNEIIEIITYKNYDTHEPSEFFAYLVFSFALDNVDV